MQPIPSAEQGLGLIAGKGNYPLLLAESARKAGVCPIVAVAFRRETDRAIERAADRVVWVTLGQLGALLRALRESGVRRAVMAGQITPTHLFNIRPDKPLLDLLRRLPRVNPDTFFGAIGEELRAIGVELQPASLYMESTFPEAGRIGGVEPDARIRRDVRMGFETAKAVSGLTIGQTVVVKDGVILAVEAFEGTDQAIRRAGKLAGPGVVVVKVAREGHDLRFDIPIVGERTLKMLRRVRAAALAVEARRTILLDREGLTRQANAQGLCFLAVNAAYPPPEEQAP